MRKPTIEYFLPFVFVIPIVALTFAVQGQDHSVTFSRINGMNGITLGKINAIVQDNLGFVWFSDQTNRCIIRYDGSSMKRYQFNPEDPAGLGGYYPEALEVGQDGALWIGFYGQGLDRFDPIKNTFTHYKHNIHDSTSLIHNVVTWVLSDKQGLVWVGTSGGISRLDPTTGKFKHYTHDPNNPRSITSNDIRKIYLDRKGTIWIGTGFGYSDNRKSGGLNRYDPQTDDFTRYLIFREQQEPDHNKVRSIYEDGYGNFWVGTSGNHLYRMDRETGTFEDFDKILLFPKNMDDTAGPERYRHITFITEDADRHLWIGTSNSGIYRYNPISQESVLFDGGLEYPDHSGWTIHAGSNGLLWMGNQEQNVYQIDIYSNKIPYTEENVTALYQESQDVLWKGTPEGLIRMDLTSGLKTYFRHDIHNPHSITSGAIWTILKDHLGFYWIGTTNGLNRLDLKTNKFIRFVHNSNDSSSLSSNDISLIFEDSKQQLWIATYQDGLNRFDRKSEKFTHFRFDPNDPNSQMMDAINAVKVDSEGYFWMALLNNDGVVRFDPVTGSSKKYLSGLTCNALLLDDQHVVWVGADNGLSFYDFQKDNFVASKLLVPVGSMSKDVFNQIWVGTPKGIHMVSADRLHISLFANKNGVNTDASQHGGWRASSAISMEDKTIMMGNSIGYLYHFDPAEIQIYPDTSILYVTEFNLEGNPRKKSFNEMVFLADEIHLNHDQNIFGITFTEIDYKNTGYNPIYYKLESYDLEWRQTSSGNAVNYYKVPPGKYVLNIKANHDHSGLEAKKTISIFIHPPWWNTHLAYGIYGVLFLTVLWFVDRIMRKRILAKERHLAKEKELEQAREIKKAYQELKSAQARLIQSEKMASLGELTAGIAHEIQNPLNFMNNFSEVNKELLLEMKEELAKGNTSEAKNIADDVIQNEEKINHHGKRADAIVKSMLQHSRSSSGQKELTDINSLCDEYLKLAYHGLRAKDKSFNAIFEINFDESIPKINVEAQDIGRVILNLINNAFYAVNERSKTGESGYQPTVSVTTKLMANSQLQIAIKDNGPGIPDAIKDKIFQPFFTTKPTGQGTGLGLSLSYDLVKAHGGELKVETKEGEGTTFVVSIPAN